MRVKLLMYMYVVLIDDKHASGIFFQQMQGLPDLFAIWTKNIYSRTIKWSNYDCIRGIEMGVSGLRSTTFVIMYQTVCTGL